MSFLHRALLSRPRSLITLAVLYTLLNTPKPLLIDDSAYYYYARQIAHDPLHPYGFEMFWYHQPEPAMDVLAPPGLPYWWSVAYALFGERPFLWKLWLLPYSLLFVFALDALFRRFARGLEAPLTWMTVLSPTFLPSLNLMLDVPALSLSLGAVALFFRACERRSFALSLAAGLLAGLGMETKYTGFMALPVMLLYGVLFFRAHLAVLAVGVAGLLFYGVESFIMAGHGGTSHFLVAVGGHAGAWDDKLGLIWPLLTITGAVGPPVILLGLVACGVGRWKVAATGAGLAAGYFLVGVLDATFHWDLSAKVGGHPAGHPHVWTLEYVVFRAYGLLAVVVIAVGVFQLFFARPGGPAAGEDFVAKEGVSADEAGEPPPGRGGPAYPAWQSPFRRLDLFVVLWLLGEVLGYFVLTPFPAVRRVMGVAVVATLLVGRLAARSCVRPERRRLVGAAAAAGVALGFFFYGIDLRDAFAEKEAAEDAAAFVRARDPGARVWYVGHWGFQHYAERAGMVPIVPYQSDLRAGDWLVVPDFLWAPPDRFGHVLAQSFHVHPTRTKLVGVREVDDGLPLQTVMGFYGGQCPLIHHEGPRVRVRVYRVVRDFVPRYDGDKYPDATLE